MFEDLERIHERPAPFEFYTAKDLWTDEHTSAQMLSFHLNESVDAASRSSEFINRSVEWIVSRFNIVEGATVADFGCGPGLYTTRLARRGAKVTGLDFSTRSIEYAKGVAAREGLSIHYLLQDYLEWETQERFDLVMMIMCDFCALSPSQRKRVLSRFLGLLKPGGSVLLDVYSLSAFDRRQEGAAFGINLLDGFWSPKRYYGFLNTFKYDRERVVLDKYSIVEADRVRTVYNWFQHFSPEALEKEFNETGLSVEELCSDVAGARFDRESTEFAVIAKRA